MEDYVKCRYPIDPIGPDSVDHRCIPWTYSRFRAPTGRMAPTENCRFQVALLCALFLNRANSLHKIAAHVDRVPAGPPVT
jgi:hypothetical protein